MPESFAPARGWSLTNVEQFKRHSPSTFEESIRVEIHKAEYVASDYPVAVIMVVDGGHQHPNGGIKGKYERRRACSTAHHLSPAIGVSQNTEVED